MIYTVTFNPAVDYAVEVDSLQSGDINRTQSEKLSYGGKGINVSVILTRLGIANRALGFIAGFSGKYIEEQLNAENIDNEFICLRNGYTRINLKIKSDVCFDINAQGPDIGDSDVDKLYKKLEKLEDGDILVLAGSIPKSLPDDIYEKIMKGLSGRNVNFVVDATGDLLLNVLKYKPFMVKPNHHELGDLFSAEIKTVDDVKKYGKKLQQLGARNVIVSRGGDGAVLLDENGNIHISENIPGEIKGSVGCGDSMVAGFIAGYTETKDYSYAFKLGAACGNATAFSDSLAKRENIEKTLEFFIDKNKTLY